MKIFIDSADLGEIEKAIEWGMCDGVTTNPSLIKTAAEKFRTGNSDTIYTLKDIPTGKEFKFAIRSCVMPAGL